jgi:hypothetical protein
LNRSGATDFEIDVRDINRFIFGDTKKTIGFSDGPYTDNDINESKNNKTSNKSYVEEDSYVNDSDLSRVAPNKKNSTSLNDLSDIKSEFLTSKLLQQLDSIVLKDISEESIKLEHSLLKSN